MNFDPKIRACEICGATNSTKPPIIPMWRESPSMLFGLCIEHAKSEDAAGRAHFYNMYDCARFGAPGPLKEAANRARFIQIEC